MGVENGRRQVSSSPCLCTPKKAIRSGKVFLKLLSCLEVVFHYTFDYLSGGTWSINAKQHRNGIPHDLFQLRAPETDGTYSERTKYGMIG